MNVRLPHFLRSLLLLVLPFAVLAGTLWQVSSGYVLYIWLMSLIGVVVFEFVQGSRWQFAKVVLQTVMVLLLIGATGWFVSPFFFLLYLLLVYVGFLYRPAAAFSLLAGLLGIFVLSAGQIDTAFDSMTLASLLFVIPLVAYMRRKYRVVEQGEVSNALVDISQEELLGGESHKTIAKPRFFGRKK